MKRFRYLIDGLIGVLMAGWMVWTFLGVPTLEVAVGAWAQKIFYLHVPSALLTYAGVFAMAFVSVATMVGKDQRWDPILQSLAEVSFVYATLVLATGPLWARPVWGVWWRWEPRLTSFLILWIMLGAFFLFRNGLPYGRKRRLYGSIYGLLVSINVPIVHLSVNFWQPEQQLHPASIGLGTTEQYTLYGGFLLMGLLFVRLVWLRYNLETKIAERVKRRYGEH